MTNILQALKNIADSSITGIPEYYHVSGKNRVNNMGETLEMYVKDIFCNTLDIEDDTTKNKAFSKYFSYMGNQNNPPDLFLKVVTLLRLKK